MTYMLPLPSGNISGNMRTNRYCSNIEKNQMHWCTWFKQYCNISKRQYTINIRYFYIHIYGIYIYIKDSSFQQMTRTNEQRYWTSTPIHQPTMLFPSFVDQVAENRGMMESTSVPPRVATISQSLELHLGIFGIKFFLEKHLQSFALPFWLADSKQCVAKWKLRFQVVSGRGGLPKILPLSYVPLKHH